MTIYERNKGYGEAFTVRRMLGREEFEELGFNAEYLDECLMANYPPCVAELTNGEIAVFEAVSKEVTGRWSKDIYRAITWE